MDSTTRYEQEQATAIEKWKKEEPGVISRAFGVVVSPLAWLVRQVVPDAAIKGALSFANSAASWMTDTDDVCRDAGVKRIGDLVGKDLKLSDKLADNVHNWAIGLATAEGAATGAIGIFGAPVDIPVLITLALRTIHKVGVCYGYESRTEQDEQFVWGVLSAASSNSVKEKVAALALLRSLEVIIAKQTWKKIGETAAKSQVGRETAIVALRSLAKQLGINLTKRKALAAIPWIGAAIGASVNGWYLKDVGWAARRMFQERWLSDSEKNKPS